MRKLSAHIDLEPGDKITVVGSPDGAMILFGGSREGFFASIPGELLGGLVDDLIAVRLQRAVATLDSNVSRLGEILDAEVERLRPRSEAAALTVAAAAVLDAQEAAAIDGGNVTRLPVRKG